MLKPRKIIKTFLAILYTNTTGGSIPHLGWKSECWFGGYEATGFFRLELNLDKRTLTPLSAHLPTLKYQKATPGVYSETYK